MQSLAPYPLEDEIGRLFAGSATPPEAPSATRSLYLDMAATIVNEAVAHWLDESGSVREPYEAQDSREGAEARFVCPAAILARHGGRPDLIEPACRSLDHLAREICRALDAGHAPFPPGYMDLFHKEMLVAVMELEPLTPSDSVARWRAALARLQPEETYEGCRRIRAGGRIHNFLAYAGVAEWLRFRMGLADRRDWLEQHTAMNLEWMTPHGLYRDPNDPMVYDLSVRQNFSEMLAYGYDGEHADALRELLRRGGVTMLLTLSPNGWTPYGGRSNLFVHNEAMGVYVAEFEARRWRDAGQPATAGAFKAAAHRMALAARPYVMDLRPPRNIKNRFAPATKHGRDSGYGWYGVYSLLAASLFARAFLIADDDIPEAPPPVGSRGTFLNLYPDFHRAFASCGDTQAQMDTRGQPGYDATGIGRIHRRGAPPALGLSLSIPAAPHFIVCCGVADRAAAIGPAWRAGRGRWESLAACSEEIADVECRPLRVADDEVRWTVIHALKDRSVTQVQQTFALREGRLDIEVALTGEADEIALEMPCLDFDGESHAEIEAGKDQAQVRHRGATLTVRVPDAERVELDPTPRPNRQAVYRVASLQRAGRSLQASIHLSPKAGA